MVNTHGARLGDMLGRFEKIIDARRRDMPWVSAGGDLVLDQLA